MSVEHRAVERLAADLGFDVQPEELCRKLEDVLVMLRLDQDPEARQRFRAGLWSESEHDAVVQCVTNGETYFFRHDSELQALQARFREQALLEPAKTLCVWSAACSSGEEAYTLAIILHAIRAALPQFQFEILATDVNPFALQRARSAQYRSWSFREESAQYRDQWFIKTKPGIWQPIPALRQSIEFAQHNLMHALEHRKRGHFDCILCRNVLIYFHGEAVIRVLELLAGSLHEDGFLVVSPSEVGLLVQHGWRKLPTQKGFFFAKPRPLGLQPEHRHSRPRRVLPVTHLYPEALLRSTVVTTAQSPSVLTKGCDDPAAAVKDWTGHGWWQLEAGDCAGAARCFRNALFAEPERLDARLGLARALQGMDRPAESRKQLQLLMRTLAALDPAQCPAELDGMAVAQFRMQISTLLQKQ